MTEHLVFRIRSQAAISLPTDRSSRGRLVAAVPAIGTKGRVAKQIAQLAARLPQRIVAKLPLFSIVSDPLPLDAELVAAGIDRAQSALDSSVDAIVWLLPPASNGRTMVAALLLTEGSPVAHLRLDAGAAPRPSPAYPSASSGSRSGITWPQLIDHWQTADGWGELTTAFPLGHHQSTDLSGAELLDLEAELFDLLKPAGDRPAPHWVPMHGDLTRWNLRTYPDGQRVLFDWEEANWGPPHADLVRHFSTAAGGEERFAELPTEVIDESRDAIHVAIDAAQDAAKQHATDRWKKADDAELLARLRSMASLTSEPPQKS